MDKVVTLVQKTLNEHKAEDIKVIDVKEKTPFADYYILATAGNTRQLNALCEIVCDELAKKKIDVGHVEGKPETGWMLIDAHHVIINIFSREERERISLDQLLTRK